MGEAAAERHAEPHARQVLAGDVGGTKTNLALFAVAENGTISELRSATFHSAEFAGLEGVVAEFLSGTRPEERTAILAACFGIAGPVVDNRVVTPNLAWEVDGARLAAGIPTPSVLLLNDLVATGYGIAALAGTELEALQEGDRAMMAEQGNRALIAAGTGLGMALLPRVGDDWLPVASEGGHADLAPRTDEEIDLLRFLKEKVGGHVSLERVLSGPGLVHLYEFLRDSGREAPSSEVEAALLAHEDAGRAIGTEGLAGAGICGAALRLFVSLYGAAAGNLALLGTATGGVFLGGGIAPKILPLLRGERFLEAFRDKGRFRPYLERIGVQVILNERAALLGAGRKAARLLLGVSSR